MTCNPLAPPEIPLSLSLQLQSLYLSQSLRQPATARPFSLSISHTAPSSSVSHLAISSLDSKRLASSSLSLGLQLQSLSVSLKLFVSLGLESQATRDSATHLTLNLSHLPLAVSPSSRRELLLAVSSLNCKRRKLSTPNSTKSTQKSR
nr:uncharacterized protein LOC108172778 [Malus domestica]